MGSAAKQVAEDGLEDPAVAVVLDLDRGVDPARGDELEGGAVVAGGDPVGVGVVASVSHCDVPGIFAKGRSIENYLKKVLLIL